MSKRTLIIAAILVLVLGAMIGRYAIAPKTTPAGGAGTASGAQDDAAKAASRAMTFTQPKAPQQ